MTRAKESFRCKVSTRIPCTSNEIGEFKLCLFGNDVGIKHLAVVFDGRDHPIASESLNEIVDGETKLERKIRGAFESINEFHLQRNRFNEKNKNEPVLVRVHSSCFTGECLFSSRCDCGEQLESAMRMMALHGQGIIVYLEQEGRGIGLEDKLKAYNLQDEGFDTVSSNLLLNHPADARTYEAAKEILYDLGVTKVDLLTNNPDKVFNLEKLGIEVVKRTPLTPSCIGDIVITSSHDYAEYRLKRTHSRLSAELHKYLETKNEPIEISSKFPVTRKRIVVEPETIKRRDPRFDSLCGHFNSDLFTKSYSFIDEYKNTEIKILQDMLKKEKKEDMRERLKYALNVMRSKKLEDEKRENANKLNREWKKEEIELIKQGKRPYYLKGRDRRNAQVVQAFHSLEEGSTFNKIDKLIEKKRKKKASSNLKSLPRRR